MFGAIAAILAAVSTAAWYTRRRREDEEDEFRRRQRMREERARALDPRRDQTYLAPHHRVRSTGASPSAMAPSRADDSTPFLLGLTTGQLLATRHERPCESSPDSQHSFDGGTFGGAGAARSWETDSVPGPSYDPPSPDPAPMCVESPAMPDTCSFDVGSS